MNELKSLEKTISEKGINDISGKLHDCIIDLLEKSSLGCLLNIQIERGIINKFPSLEKNELIKNTREILFRLCKQGVLDALIPQNITKAWKIKNIPKTEIIVAENHQETIKLINEGSYYSWEFEPLLEKSDILFKYKSDQFDTRYILDNIPELFLESLNILRLKLDANPKIGYKLIWVLSAIRDMHIL